MAEEEVLIEVEAMQAVYGDDCIVLSQFPPTLHVHLKPRTADIASEQFVEAVLGIRAGPKYPVEAPHMYIVESKGFGEDGQKRLLTSVCQKACEFSSSPMLVAVCEEAVEQLSIMNHPDGDCPLCLYPLVPSDAQENESPYMKLMSCFHCFHSECILRWFNWLQVETEMNHKSSTNTAPRAPGARKHLPEMPESMQESSGNCPVCRKVFHSKDIEHVLNLARPCSSKLRLLCEPEADDNEKLLQSDPEIIRRQKFEAILRLQQENSGLIEPEKNVIRACMYNPEPNTTPVPMLSEETSVQQQAPTAALNISSHSSSNVPENRNGSSSVASSSNHRRKSNSRKHNVPNSRKPAQWVAKDTRTTG